MAGERTLVIRYPDLGATVRARLWDDLNKELCDLMWSHLPIESIQSHMMASGEGMYCPHRIVAMVPTQTILLTELPVGAVNMNTIDYKSISIKYGVLTEPLPASPVARVVQEDLELLKRIGREVYIANALTHKPIKVIFERG